MELLDNEFQLAAAGMGPDQSLEAREARAESATRFADQNDASALETLDQFSPELLSVSTKPISAEGREVVEYLDPTTALVEAPGDDPGTAIVESTTPIVDRDQDAGERAEVDLALDTAGGEANVENPLIDVEIPDAAGGKAAVEEIGIELEGAAAAEAEVFRGATVYPNSLPDTDYALKPTLAGLGVSFHLRSQDSPERFELALEVPDDAAVEAGDPSGRPPTSAEIVESSGETIATVSPAVAWDAEGETVPVGVTVDGDAVVLDVLHRDRDLAYPLVVDPMISSEQIPNSGASSRWVPYRYTAQSYPYDLIGSYEANGYRYMDASAQYYFPPWVAHFYDTEYAGWYWRAPGTDSRVSGFWIYNIWHWQNSSLFQAGVLTPNWCCWQGLAQFSGDLGEYSAAPHPSSPTNGNYAYVRTMANGTGWRTPRSGTLAFQGAFATTYVQLTDDNPPSSSWASTGSPPPGWASSGTVTPVVRARDYGVGVKKFELKAVGDGGSAIFTRTRTHSCTNTTSAPCTTGADVDSNNGAVSGNDFAINLATLPEGISSVTARSADLAGASSNAWSGATSPITIKIDRTAPTVDVAAAQAALGSGQISQTTSVPFTARDRQADGSGPSAGVTKLEIKVDNTVVQTYTQSCSDSCEMTRTWSLDPDQFAAGSHTLKVVATDARNQSTTSSTLNFSIGPPETTIIGFASGQATSSHTATFDFTSTRNNSTFACRLDTGAWENPCSSPKTYSNLAEGHHGFEVKATSASGQADPTPDSRIWTVDSVNPVSTVACPPAPAWSQSEVTCAITADDPGQPEASGVINRRYRTSVDGGPWSEWTEAGASQSFAVAAEGTTEVEVRAEDRAGNVSTAATATVKIDTHDPAAWIDCAFGGIWTRADVGCEVNASDLGSQVETMLYRTRPSDGSWSGWIEAANGEFDVTQEGITEIQAQAIDHAGRISPISATHSVRIDRAAPTADVISIDSDPVSPQPFLRGAVTFDSSVTDPLSKPKSVKLEAFADGSSTPLATCNQNGLGALIVIVECGLASTLSGEGTTVDFRLVAEDYAGNVTEASLDEQMIDNTAPGHSLAGYSAAWRPDTQTYALSATGENPGSGPAELQWRVAGGEIQSDDAPAGDPQAEVVVADAGTSNLEIRARDEAGNYSAWTSRTVRIDRTDPTAEIGCGAGDAWLQETDCAISFADAGGSGLERRKFRVHMEDGGWSDWAEVNNTPDFALEDGISEIEAWAIDNAGREVTATKTAKVDSSAPDIELSRGPDDVLVEETDVAIDVTEPGNDLISKSGVVEVVLTVDGEVEDTYSQECLEGDCSVAEVWTLDPNDYPTGPRSISVEATDVAGNVSTKELTLITCGDEESDAERVECVTARANPDAVGPPESSETDEGEVIEPQVEETTGGFEVTGSDVLSTIGTEADDGFSVETDAGAVTLLPQGLEDGAEGEVGTTDSTVVYPETDDGQHTVVRPQAGGIETFTTIEETSAATVEQSWTVDVEAVDETLEMAGDGGVNIVNEDAPEITLEDVAPRPEVIPATQEELDEGIASEEIPAGTNLSNPPSAPTAASDVVATEEPPEAPVTPADEPVDEEPGTEIAPEPLPESSAAPEARAILESELGDAAAPVIADATTGLSDAASDAAPINAPIVASEDAEDEAALNEEEAVVAKIEPPISVDASGADVDTSLSISGDTVTMTVDAAGHQDSLPIVADPWVTVYDPYEVELCCRKTYREEPYISDYWDQWAQLGWWYPHWMKRHAQNWWRTQDIWGRYSGWFLVKIWDNYYVLRDNHEGYIYTVTRWPIYSTRQVYVGKRPYKEVRWAPRSAHNQPEVWFGYSNGNINQEDDLDKADRDGANMVRQMIPWCEMEPQPGNIQWGLIDNFLTRVIREDRDDGPDDELSATLTLLGAPRWATARGQGVGCLNFGEPALAPAGEYGLRRWRSFVEAVIDHIKKTKGPSGTRLSDAVGAIEIWNEPNHGAHFWGKWEQPDPNQPGSFVPDPGGDPQDYGTVYEKAVAAAGPKRGDLPNKIALISGGLLPEDNKNDPAYDAKFMNQLRQRLGGSSAFVDGIGVHTYANRKYSANMASNNAVEDFDRVGEAAGVGRRNRWVTEMGYPEFPHPDDPSGHPGYSSYDARQADVLRTMVAKLANANASAVLVHTLVDTNVNDGLEQRRMGTMRSLSAPKPAYCALGRWAREKKLVQSAPGGCTSRP